jgi:transcriptional regulator with XRE-family HTH domain
MTFKGMKNSWLAFPLGVSRELVRQWRNKISYPNEEFIQKIANQLGCLVEELTHPIYSSNIIKLMKKHDITKEALAERINRPVEYVEKWLILDDSMINHLHMSANDIYGLMDTFSCSEKDIFETPEQIETMSLNEWARREGVPSTRAKDLFELNIIDGAIHTEYGILVKTDVFVPKNSKQLVTMTKKRPKYGSYNWGEFAQRLSQAMEICGVSNTTMAEATGVVPTTVSHWRAGVRTPSENKLPTIAKFCQSSIEYLVQAA